MKRPTQSHPVTGSGLSRPAPSRAVPRPELPTADADRAPYRGGAAAAPPHPDDETLPAQPASELGIPPRQRSLPEPAAAPDGLRSGPPGAAEGAGGEQYGGIPRRDEQLFAGRYRIERKLGRGGMGSVFLATQLAVDRLVAIKVLENVSDDGVMVARFQREARVIAQLQHPNIVNLIDFGENERGQLYLVMEYIDGEPLTSLIKREAPLAPARVVQIAIQVTEALVAAHDINVVHRDLKPDNIMLLGGGSRRDYVKILDFGIAKVKRTDPGQQDTIQTRAGLIVGSLRYISPEQVESKEVTVQTDFYALGGILYELLCGRRVFDHASPADCAIAHLTEPPKPPSIDGVPLAGPLVDLIMQCLEKAPARRPPSAHVVIAMLRGCEHAPLRQGSRPGNGDIATSEHADVHADATELDLRFGAGGHAALDAAFAAPPPAVSLVPASRPVSRPAPRAAADVLAPSIEHTVTAYGERGLDARARSMTDCNIDLARRPEAAPAGPGADLSLWGPPGTGNDPAHTVTHHAPITPPGARRGVHPLLWVLVLVGLAGIGVLIYVLAFAPAGDAGHGTVSGAPAGPGEREAQIDPLSPPLVRPELALAAEAPDAAAMVADDAASTVDAPLAPEPAALADAALAVVAGAGAALPPVAANAVRIASEPEEAEVFLGELSLGLTPVTITWDGDGAAPRLRLVKADHRPAKVILRRADVGQVRTVTLDPLR